MRKLRSTLAYAGVGFTIGFTSSAGDYVATRIIDGPARYGVATLPDIHWMLGFCAEAGAVWAVIAMAAFSVMQWVLNVGEPPWTCLAKMFLAGVGIQTVSAALIHSLFMHSATGRGLNEYLGLALELLGGVLPDLLTGYVIFATHNGRKARQSPSIATTR